MPHLWRVGMYGKQSTPPDELDIFPRADVINHSAATNAFETSGQWRAHWRSGRSRRTGLRRQT